jgi:hypothetical protein
MKAVLDYGARQLVAGFTRDGYGPSFTGTGLAGRSTLTALWNRGLITPAPSPLYGYVLTYAGIHEALPAILEAMDNVRTKALKDQKSEWPGRRAAAEEALRGLARLQYLLVCIGQA